MGAYRSKAKERIDFDNMIMLEELYIKNFVLVEDINLRFSTGINVLSGETGAGKSIIIDALGVMLGDRVNTDFVRDNHHRAVIEGVFNVGGNKGARLFLTQQGLTDDQEPDKVILSREINPGGKSAARINSHPVTISVLKALTSNLVDIHLQDDRQNILKPAYYLDYVDGFAGNVEKIQDEVATRYQALQLRQKQLLELQASHQHRHQRIDYLDFQIQEIESSHLQTDEEEELTLKRDRIKNASRLLKGSDRLLELLYNAGDASSAHDQVARGLDEVTQLKNDSFFASLAEPLENIYYSLQEVSRRLADFKETLDFEPGELEEAENRLYQLNRLKTKYGAGVEDILKYLEMARLERDELLVSEDRLEQVRQDIEAIRANYMRAAQELSRQRSQAADILAQKMGNELIDLNMPAVGFEVQMSRKDTPGPKGIDEVEFWFSPNPGEELKPMSRIASGGEISRFILALKTALAGIYKIPTLIFDEIDVGLGGEALKSVARKLGELARTHQLILVTHSPQVASLGDRNLTVEKTVVDGQTYTMVKELDAEGKLIEVARMMAGEDYSQLTLEHAREMIAAAQPQDRPE
ncbi:MAG: DNA repair protein RecN [Syntrophomonas sp.]|nr:DNA repair protein RecN [Syntrophomonas sp.]